MSTAKKELTFNIGFENQEDCDRLNKEGYDFKPYEEQVLSMCRDIIDAVEEVGKAGGFFMYDGINVKVSVEYEEENK